MSPTSEGVIAIDGPAGSGKSTVSRALAERLGIDRLDTGAMYRAVAWAAIDRQIDPADREAVAKLADGLVITIGARTEVDGKDVTEAIREPDVNRVVSLVAAIPAVRQILVESQRAWMATRKAAVVEGRDIGSVVFPDAPVKIYLTASPDERARRRAEESSTSLSQRDRIDSTRSASPLQVAEGAKVIDTTGRPIEEVVDEVVGCL
jgi:CMP/dCMP kinase